MRKLIVKIAYVIYALKSINRLHIGDIVFYQGKECMLIQGVADPRWDLLPLDKENMDKSLRTVFKNIHKSEFKTAKNAKVYWERFKSNYQFKMGNWFLIDTYQKSLFDSI
jgi:hypothetical protein